MLELYTNYDIHQKRKCIYPVASASVDKKDLFENTPVPKALATLAVPTIVSQLINLVYNIVDAFFIGRTGNSYMMAATTLTLTIVLLTIAFGNMFGVGGGSLVARLLGRQDPEGARRVSAFSLYGCVAISVTYSVIIGLFLQPILMFLGASPETIGYATQYCTIVTVFGCAPNVLSMVTAALLRNVGYAKQASMGLSLGGILNIFLDPLFMFVLLPSGYEVVGAAVATLLSNVFSCIFLLLAYRKASRTAALSLSPKAALAVGRQNLKELFSVGIPSFTLSFLFDLANVFLNMLAAGHNDLILAAIGIVMKVERIPVAINVGICQGMMPLVAYNFSSGNHTRMKEVISTARRTGVLISIAAIVFFQFAASPVTRMFLSTSAGDAATALTTLGYAAIFLRIRSLASPSQYLNFHTSFCLQATGNGPGTILHAVVRELVVYIPIMFLLDRLFGEYGLTSALLVGETITAIFALWLLNRWLNSRRAAIHAK